MSRVAQLLTFAAITSGCGSELRAPAGRIGDTALETTSEDSANDASIETGDEPRADAVADTVAETFAPDLPDDATAETITVDTHDDVDDAEVADTTDASNDEIVEIVETVEADTIVDPADAIVGPTFGIVTWTIRTGIDGSEDDAAGTAYCLGASHCGVPSNALNWDDRDVRGLDVWHIDGAQLGSGLTRDAIDRVEIRFPSADAWSIACVQVAVDGETIHCAMTDALLGLAPGAEAVWSESPRIECDTCWDEVLTHGPVVGGTSDTTSRIWVRTDSARPVELRLGANPTAMRASAPVAVATPAAKDDFTYTFDLAGLKPATTYYYALDVGGRRYPPDAEPAFRFRTAPPAGEPSAFSFGVASCARADPGNAPSQPAFAALDRVAPDFFLFNGDNVYFDPTQNGQITDVGGARAYYREGLQRRFSWASPTPSARADYGRDARADFLGHTPVFAVWDDHDFLHDNSYGVSNGVPDPDRLWTRQVFVEYWPNPAYGESGDGIYHRFAWGDVDVFMLDGRYFKDIDRSTFLGVVQLQWLFDGLRASTATFKLLVDGSDWSPESISDSWAGWPEEREVIFDFIVEARIEGVVVVSGDSHRSELRVFPGSDGGYAIPQIVSSGVATTIRGCPVTNEFVEVSGTASCYGADSAATPSFVVVDVDTTRADPRMTATVYDDRGLAQRSLAFNRSALVFRSPAELDRRDADFDGDGYADLAIGVPGEDLSGVDDGLVHVLYGTNAGLHTTGSVALTQAVLSGANEAGDRFGEVLAHGDFDGDGYDDLAIGVPGEDYANHPGTGRAVVVRGAAGGLAGSETLDIEDDASALDDQRMGAALAVGDFDGDGDDDLAVGTPGDGGGAVRIFAGGPGPMARGPKLALAPAAGSADDALGSALAAGDFDGDGYDDLAVGAPGGGDVATGAGAVLIWVGGPLGLEPEPARVIVPADAGVANALGLAFGSVLLARDLDGDGIDDVAIGAPGAAAGAGLAARFDGVAGEGLESDGQRWVLPSLVTGAAGVAGDGMGSALAAADFDGNGVAELVIGVPGRAAGRGIALVRFANGSVKTLSQDVTNWTVGAVGDRFGAALAAGDFDADGRADLAVGSPGDQIGGAAGGVVDVFPGRVGGFDGPNLLYGLRMTQRWFQGVQRLGGNEVVEADDRLGASLGR